MNSFCPGANGLSHYTDDVDKNMNMTLKNDEGKKVTLSVCSCCKCLYVSAVGK